MSNPPFKPHFDFITLFPDAIDVWLRTSILGRALEKGLFSYRLVQLRDFSQDRHRSVDDAPYGGGGGMVLRVEPLVAAVESLKAQAPEAQVVCFSPRGQRLDTGLLDTLVQAPGPHHWIMVCGHYEGFDQRFIDHWVDREVSLGDFVLTGGELPAVALADALIRRVEGTLADAQAHEAES
ncbi:tRNA (guanosine(37)-N1)-methyltransferase TrmD, partial [bacterium]|nr:tRNA (guanosine(37)-N1)-methyltransferase TrmD [bacterium]